jgi:hypothetical protein
VATLAEGPVTVVLYFRCCMLSYFGCVCDRDIATGFGDRDVLKGRIVMRARAMPKAICSSPHSLVSRLVPQLGEFKKGSGGPALAARRGI